MAQASRAATSIETYVGPSLPGMKHARSMASRSALVERYVSECPAVESLLVPASGLAQSLRDVRTVGHPLFVAAQAVRQYIAG